MGLFQKLLGRLEKTRQKFGDSLRRILRSHSQMDEQFFEELEEALLSADVGVDTTERIIEQLKQRSRSTKRKEDEAGNSIQEALLEVLQEVLQPDEVIPPLNLQFRPAVILIVGVNGSGKTTSIAKLTHYFQQQGKRVLLAAADTFRAAATEQLLIWGERLNVTVIQQQQGADPAAVAFDAFQAARARNYDLLIIDTAGRLHNKANLMQELNKITRVLKKQDPNAPHEVLLVLDANTGQNAIQQAKVFQEISGVTGLILAKLDGTAKGGAVLSICRELNLPLRFIGIGEKADDLEVFDPSAYARAIIEPLENER
ncbi:MAG: signal recognition particle-docking protein FtsY [bacterium]